jgi:hypothetical protein
MLTVLRVTRAWMAIMCVVAIVISVPLLATAAPVRHRERMAWAGWHALVGFRDAHYARRYWAELWFSWTSHPIVALRVVDQQRLLASSVRGRTTDNPHTTTSVPEPSPRPIGRPIPAPAPTPGPSGVPMPIGDVPGWHQVFADDFTTNVPIGQFPRAVAARWGGSYPDGWTDTSGAGTYMPSQVVSVSGGVMDLYLHTAGAVHMVAAPVPSLPTMTYGRYVIRFRSDAIPGYKTAWLLWPDSGVWPRDGEIDFPEGSLDGTIAGFVHYQGGTSGSDQYVMPDTGVTYTGWHTAQIDWLPSGVTFSLDGNVVGQTTSRVPNTPMRWVIQTETDGGAPPASSAGNLQIDWVSVYAPGI